MRVAVANLVPNPYRKIEKYPIRREKVEKLKASIDDTGFWDNILARPKPGHSGTTESLRGNLESDGDSDLDYENMLVGPRIQENDDSWYMLMDDCSVINVRLLGQELAFYGQPIVEIAYGHHRLTALRELGIEEVDIPIKDLDDRTMIKIMANENMEDWETNTSVINETVLTVKEFLMIDHEKHVGTQEVLTFLGAGWNKTVVETALATIRDEDVDREAVEVFETPAHAQRFRRTMNSPVYKDLVPKEEQKAFAEEVKEEATKLAKENKASGGELTGDHIVTATQNLIKKKAPVSTQISREVAVSENYKTQGKIFYKAMRTLMNLQAGDQWASGLDPEQREKIETQYVEKIETLIARWRND